METPSPIFPTVNGATAPLQVAYGSAQLTHVGEGAEGLMFAENVANLPLRSVVALDATFFLFKKIEVK